MARIVFDLDGTLVDSAPTLAASANAMLVEFGRDPVPVETVIGFVGQGMRRLVERLLEHGGGVPEAGVDPFFDRFRVIYEADPLTGTVLYPGVTAALETLARAGDGLAVCTQKSDAPALTILRGLAMMPPVTGFAGGDTLKVLKPDPAMFWHAADQLAPGPAIMIGDSMTDALTARAAGVPFLLRAGGYLHEPVADVPHDGIFEDFHALPDLIGEVLARA